MEKLDEGGQPMVWLLLKALYGLKQSGNRWMMLLINQGAQEAGHEAVDGGHARHCGTGWTA